jgi:hypothetical protein
LFCMGTYPLNPLRAGLLEDIKALDMHPGCGHSVLMNRNKQPWQNIDYVYGLFSRQKRQARQLYRVFVEKGVAEVLTAYGKSPQTVKARSLLCF